MFCVKYRKDIFLNDVYAVHLKELLLEIGKRYFLTFETIGIDENHVHMLVQSVPKYSPSRVMQIIKSITAKEMFKSFPLIRDQLWGGEFWSDSGYIGTVGEGVNADIIRNYIKNQGKNSDQLKLSDF